MFQGNRLNDKELQDIADGITHSDSRQAKDTFLELLKNENPDFPIKKLFKPQVFELVDQIHKVLARIIHEAVIREQESGGVGWNVGRW